MPARKQVQLDELDKLEEGQADKPAEPQKRAYTPRRPRVSKEQLQKELAQGIVITQSFLFLALPLDKDDALNADEVTLLADAISDELITHKRLLEWYRRMSVVGTHGKLLYAVMTISLPRLARHGLIPHFPGAHDESTDTAQDAVSA